jgi:hypothetical protein
MAGVPAKTREPLPARELKATTTPAIKGRRGEEGRHVLTCQKGKKEQQEKDKSPPQADEPKHGRKEEKEDHASLC